MDAFGRNLNKGVLSGGAVARCRQEPGDSGNQLARAVGLGHDCRNPLAPGVRVQYRVIAVWGDGIIDPDTGRFTNYTLGNASSNLNITPLRR